MTKHPVIFLISMVLTILLFDQLKHELRARHSLVDQHRAMEFGVKP